MTWYTATTKLVGGEGFTRMLEISWDPKNNELYNGTSIYSPVPYEQQDFSESRQ